jgi:hypothetical protein
MSPAIREAIERLFNIVDAFACGVFMPRREKDELTYASRLLNTLGEREAKE